MTCFCTFMKHTHTHSPSFAHTHTPSLTPSLTHHFVFVVQIVQSCLGSRGLPVTAQVVSFPWQEEMCLRVMKEIETAVGKQERLDIAV